MRNLKIIAAIAIALPAAAIAQVGPNPSVSGGSQDPTMGSSTDSATAPDDVRPGASTSSTMGQMSSPAGSNSSTGATGSVAATTGDPATDSSATTTTSTRTGTKAMGKSRSKPR